MSLNEQLIEDIETQFLQGEGILKLIDKIPNEEKELKLLSKIKEMIKLKEKDIKSRPIIDEVSLYLKVELKPTPLQEMVKNELYVAIYGENMFFYIIYIKDIEIVNNYLLINGLTLEHQLLKNKHRFKNIHQKFLSWEVSPGFIWHKVIDEAFIDEARKLI